MFIDHTSLQQILYVLLPALAAYPLLTSLLRFRRLKRLQQQYHYPTRESLARMTDKEAWEIQKVILQLEFPLIYIKSLQFALFRTYGIPTISRTLTRTSQFSDPRFAFKRYNDTRVLIGEFVAWEPASDRAQTAIARINFVHSGYRSSNSIREEDMLYTLSLFATEPIRFIDSYEWRKLTDLEKCALGTYWKSLGDAFGISYENLPSGKTGFKDGLHWLEEVTAWSQAYEVRAMVPAESNKQTADQTTSILVYMFPNRLKYLGEYFVSYMMDDRLRRAMLNEPPPPSWSKFFASLLEIRRFFLRYLALPRPYFLRATNFSEEPDAQSGHYFATSWDNEPYYVKPTLWNRWLSPGAWVTWLMGLPVPGDEGEKYSPKGYDIADLGPNAFEGRGKDYISRQKEMLKTARTGQCPFH